MNNLHKEWNLQQWQDAIEDNSWNIDSGHGRSWFGWFLFSIKQ